MVRPAPLFLRGIPKVRGFALSPPGDRIALLGPKAGVIVCDVATGRQLYRLNDGSARVTSLAFSASGKLLAVAFREGEKPRVHLYDAATGKRLRSLRDAWTPATGLCFAKHDTELVSDVPHVRFWDVATGKLLRSFKSVYVSGGLCLSPKERWIATYHRPPLTHRPSEGGHAIAIVQPAGAITIWSLPSGKAMRCHLSLGNAHALCFSADGSWLFSAESHGLMARRPSGCHRKELLRGIFTRVAGSRDGRWLAASGTAKAIALLDAKSGRLSRKIALSDSELLGLDFTPDGDYLVSAGAVEGLRFRPLKK